MRQVKQPLTEREQEALTWARQQHHWRKRYDVTLEQHMVAMPAHMRLPDFYPEKARQEKLDHWAYWYEQPFGVPEWNENVAIVRRLLRERRV